MLLSGRIDKIVTPETFISRSSLEKFLFLSSVATVAFLLALSLLQLFRFGFLTSKPMVRGLSVTNLTDVSLTLSWETSTPSSGYIVYGSSAEELNIKAFDNNSAEDPANFTTVRHIVTLTDLKPDTYYYYEIISGEENISLANGKPLTPLKTAVSSFLTDPNLRQ